MDMLYVFFVKGIIRPTPDLPHKGQAMRDFDEFFAINLNKLFFICDLLLHDDHVTTLQYALDFWADFLRYVYSQNDSAKLALQREISMAKCKTAVNPMR